MASRLLAAAYSPRSTVGGEAGVERTELERMERMIDREIKARFPAGTVRRVALLQPGDDPVIEPEELLVRVFIEAPGGSAGDRRSLDGWAEAHQARMRRLRRELSLRLPPARLLEFAVDDASDPGARITMPHDPALTDEPLSAREIVRTALALLRTGYVFPDRAEQAATAIEARLAAGEYDDLDEDALAGRLTSQLHEVCADGHLRVRTTPPRPARPARPGPAGPAGPGPDRRPWERPLNYGIYRAERLEGNVGYLDLRGVADPQDAGPVIAAAMGLACRGQHARFLPAAIRADRAAASPAARHSVYAACGGLP